MERHFSEQEVSDIIRLAAEKQVRQRPAGAPASTGVSESELKHVAGELGIDPTALQAAISEVSSIGLEDTGDLSSIDRIIERSIDGDLAQEDFGIVLEEFVPASGIGNQPVSLGNSLSYQSLVGMAQCNINVTNRNGKTTLRVKSNAFLAALPTFLPALFASIISNVIIWEEIRPRPEVGIPFAALFPVFFLILAYFAFKSLIRYSNKKVIDLANRTTAKLSESAAHLRGNINKSGIPLPEVESSVEETRL